MYTGCKCTRNSVAGVERAHTTMHSSVLSIYNHPRLCYCYKTRADSMQHSTLLSPAPIS